MHNVTIQEIKPKITPLLKRAGVIRSAIFGSFAKGTGDEKSDIDILVEFKAGKTLLDLIALKAELENALAQQVDLLTYKSLSPFLKDKILQEQVSIYG